MEPNISYSVSQSQSADDMKEVSYYKLRAEILEKTTDSLVKANQEMCINNDRYIDDIRMLALEKVKLQKSIEMMSDGNAELIEANRLREKEYNSKVKELQMNNAYMKLFTVILVLAMVLNMMNIQPSLDFLV